MGDGQWNAADTGRFWSYTAHCPRVLTCSTWGNIFQFCPLIVAISWIPEIRETPIRLDTSGAPLG